MSLESFTRAYLDCALWSSSIGPGHDCAEDTSLQSAGYDLDDMAAESLATMREECKAFYDANVSAWGEHWSDEQAGHDYWLTRNRHGAGFWDRYARGDGYSIGTRLTDASHSDGERDLYIGDDGKIYQA